MILAYRDGALVELFMLILLGMCYILCTSVYALLGGQSPRFFFDIFCWFRVDIFSSSQHISGTTYFRDHSAQPMVFYFRLRN
jgi:hypothetical protein